MFFLSAERLSDFYIRVGNSFNPSEQLSFDPATLTLCQYQEDAICPGETRDFNCLDGPIEGRYVTVHFPEDKTEYLTLCEVEVFENTASASAGFLNNCEYMS